MKASFLACIFFVVCILGSVRAANINVTIVTNPPQGGTVTGGGMYPAGANANVNAEASNGWYIANVTDNGGETIFYAIALDNAKQTGDLTTLTNEYENDILNSDTTFIYTFASASPSLNQALTNTAATTGSQVMLNSGVTGRQPMQYAWLYGNQPIPNATNASLVFSNVQPTNSGMYAVAVSNVFGTTNATVNLVARDLLVFVNGNAVTNAVTNVGASTVALQSRFAPNDLIFYTLDGTTPNPASTQYSQPFQVSSTATIRAIAYTNTFLQTAFSDTIPLTIIPTYTLTIPSLSGGTVALYPPGGVYTNQTVVNLTATPGSGWTFLGWIGAPLSNSPSVNYMVTGNATLIPLFGTTLSTNVVGSGTLSIVPASPVYLSGTSVLVTAIPNPGNYFVSWGGALSGSLNSGVVFIVSPAPLLVSALFAAVPSGDVSLTLLADGDGFVLPYNAGNVFPTGATNTIIAFPNPGEQFVGWSGDASGTNNYWPVTFASNLVITAHFTTHSSLSLSQSAGGMNVSLSGAIRTVFRIDASSNLSTWTPLGYVTNFGSFAVYPASFPDPVTNAPARFYRAVAQ